MVGLVWVLRCYYGLGRALGVLLGGFTDCSLVSDVLPSYAELSI